MDAPDLRPRRRPFTSLPSPRALLQSPRVAAAAIRQTFADGEAALRENAGRTVKRRLRTTVVASLVVLASIVATVLAWLLFQAGTAAQAPRGTSPYERSCALFCEGPILHAIQMARVFNDSKTFVGEARTSLKGGGRWGIGKRTAQAPCSHHHSILTSTSASPLPAHAHPPCRHARAP
jgi:hypothetical protein